MRQEIRNRCPRPTNENPMMASSKPALCNIRILVKSLRKKTTVAKRCESPDGGQNHGAKITGPWLRCPSRRADTSID